VNISLSFGFFCFQNSSKVNKNIDLEALSLHDWKITATVDTGDLSFERPMSFILFKAMKLKVTYDKNESDEQISRSIKLEFQCGKFYSFFNVSKVQSFSGKNPEMEYSFCSKEDTLTWPQVSIYHTPSKGILVMYFCNKNFEFVVVLTSGRELSNELKAEVSFETEKALKIHFSNLLRIFNFTFIDTDLKFSPDCEEAKSNCEKSKVKFNDRKTIQKEINQEGTNILWKGFIGVLVTIGVLIAVIKITFEVIKAIKKFRNNVQVYPVSFYID
jgi:hypothetical protein